MHRKERRAGQRGSLFKRRDAAGRPAGPVPEGWGGGLRDAASASGRGVPLHWALAFLASLGRRSQRGPCDF